MRFSSVLGGVLVSTLLGMSAISYPIVNDGSIINENGVKISNNEYGILQTNRI